MGGDDREDGKMIYCEPRQVGMALRAFRLFTDGARNQQLLPGGNQLMLPGK
jgi:hypothetical protein